MTPWEAEAARPFQIREDGGLMARTVTAAEAFALIDSWAEADGLNSVVDFVVYTRVNGRHVRVERPS